MRPLRCQLRVGEWEDYQAAYCGLCHALKARCGWRARFVLNYDFVFLALLLDDGREGTVCPRRCAVHPFRPRPCASRRPALDLAAEESVILAWYQLRDTLADEGWRRRLGSRAALLFLRGPHRRCAQAQPEFEEETRRCLEELRALEAVRSPELDRVADAFARVLRGAAPVTGRPEVDRPRGELLYHLGRWIYLADGADDLAEDRVKGRYNPVDARFGGEPDLDYLSTTMTHSLSLAQSAFQLLPRTKWSDLLENILYQGLPLVQQEALAGRWSRRQNERGRRHP